MVRIYFSLIVASLLVLGACGKESNFKTAPAESFAAAAPAPGPAPEPAPVDRPCQSGHGYSGQFCCSDDQGNFCRDGLTCNARSLTCQ